MLRRLMSNSKTMFSHFLLAVAILLSCGALLPAWGIIPLPSEDSHTISLNGTWRFKLEQAPTPPRTPGLGSGPLPIICPTNFEAFYRADYAEDAAWHDLAVPGNWEMAGFSPTTYNNPDNASGFYKLSFAVPAD